MRIICEQTEPNQWLAWVEGNIGQAFPGPTATAATEGLAESLDGVSPDSLVIVKSESRLGRFVFTADTTCPDCKGSGQYVGLVETGDCKSCGGSGRTGGQLPPIPF